MPRNPKPWLRKQTKTWYVKIDGQQIRLANNRKEAYQVFHRLMADRADGKKNCGIGTSQELLACEVADKFLVWCDKHREARTTATYKDHLERFFRWLPRGKTMAASELKPYHVIEYLGAHEWGTSFSRNAAASVQRVFKWAVSVGLLDSHPCTTIPKPKAGRRETPMSEAEYAAILKHSRSEFGDVVTFCWETSARPIEIRRMKVEFVNLAAMRVMFPVVESKGKRKRRVIYLTKVAAEILERRLATASDWVFTNARNEPWKETNFNNRMERLKQFTGRKCALYDARHAFGTRKLLEGHPASIVAAWMGHSSPQMLEQHYGHVDQAGDHLLAALNASTVGATKTVESSL